MRELALLAAISPGAANYAKDRIWHYYLKPEASENLCIGIEDGESGYIFANLNPSDEQELLPILEAALREQITKKDSGHQYFNCHGKNRILRELAIKLGYKLDMSGYHMELVGSIPQNVPLLKPYRKPYETTDLEDYIRLFSAAYESLMLDNGWDPGYYESNREGFSSFLAQAAGRDCLWGWYLQQKLVGIGLIDQNYIRDLAVMPEAQGQGIGSMILADLVKTMKERGLGPIRLRVAENNYAPIRLYQKLGFQMISHFAEHFLS